MINKLFKNPIYYMWKGILFLVALFGYPTILYLWYQEICRLYQEKELFQFLIFFPLSLIMIGLLVILGYLFNNIIDNAKGWAEEENF